MKNQLKLRRSEILEAYMDDVWFTARTCAAFASLFHGIVELRNTVGLELNMEKTCILLLGRIPAEQWRTLLRSAMGGQGQ
eukprot:496631-Amphidinium_carterae.1